MVHPISPLLIYVNCIDNSVDCCWKSFADDFKLYLSFSRNTCVPVLQRIRQLKSNLNKVRSVARAWYLSRGGQTAGVVWGAGVGEICVSKTVSSAHVVESFL